MPRKIFTQMRLPVERPDCCADCPLIGVVPADERERGVRQGYYCLGIYTLDGFPRLTSKGIHSSAKAYKAMGRKLHRECDELWDAWMTLPGRLFGIPTEVYTSYRLPYEQEQMRKMCPQFIFRNYGKNNKNDKKDDAE